jgi:hypothetical protein
MLPGYPQSKHGGWCQQTSALIQNRISVRRLQDFVNELITHDASLSHSFHEATSDPMKEQENKAKISPPLKKARFSRVCRAVCPARFA